MQILNIQQPLVLKDNIFYYNPTARVSLCAREMLSYVSEDT